MIVSSPGGALDALQDALATPKTFAEIAVRLPVVHSGVVPVLIVTVPDGLSGGELDRPDENEATSSPVTVTV
jgi:hypothetical protein